VVAFVWINISSDDVSHCDTVLFYAFVDVCSTRFVQFLLWEATQSAVMPR